MDENNLNKHKQFGYKKFHGTESLLIKFMNDTIIGVDSRNGVVVLLLDLSAAFDTVDHRKLLNILCHEYGIQGTALKWFKSFLIGRSQRVRVGESLSEPLELSFGVPQGSVLGPVLFNIYISSISCVFSGYNFSYLGYADDSMGYQVFSLPSENNLLHHTIPEFLKSLKIWMSEYFLKLNESKTEIIILASP